MNLTLLIIEPYMHWNAVFDNFNVFSACAL